MIIEGIVKKNQIIIPNYWNLKDGKVLVDVKLSESEEKIEDTELKETAKVLIEHWKEEKKQEVPIDSKKIEKAAKKLGLKGITPGDLINGEF